MPDKNHQFQTVTLTFADGRKATYTGRVQIDGDEPLRVTLVEFSLPNQLPDGMFWDSIFPSEYKGPKLVPSEPEDA